MQEDREVFNQQFYDRLASTLTYKQSWMHRKQWQFVGCPGVIRCDDVCNPHKSSVSRYIIKIARYADNYGYDDLYVVIQKSQYDALTQHHVRDFAVSIEPLSNPDSLNPERLISHIKYEDFYVINYIKGDATNPIAKGNKIICHICNDRGGWGKGFVLALSKKWKEPEEAYRKSYKDKKISLNHVEIVQVKPDIWVANMVAQTGLGEHNGRPPIRYPAVTECLKQVDKFALEINATLHMPRIGCGLAGGTWDKVQPILQQHCKSDIWVYDI